MTFDNKINKHNLYIFIFLLITADFLFLSVQCLKQSRFDIPERFHNEPAETEFSSLSTIYKPVDLSFGTPNILPPFFLRDALTNLSMSFDALVHQYRFPTEGAIELRKEIASLYSKLINRTLDPVKNVMVTLGSTEALYLALMVHTIPGDEWILIEPSYERYFAVVKLTGGILRSFVLKQRTARSKFGFGDFVLDKDELTKTFNAKTKGIIINNPQNPTGKIFTKEELMFIAELAIKWDTLIISDEVYEWTIFDSKNKHIRIASLGDEIFNRTITLSSISKTFFATGWRIGWAYGPSKLIQNLIAPQPYMVVSLTTYAQLAAAEGLRKTRLELGHPNSYFDKVPKLLERKRKFVVEVLKQIGMDPIVPQSGYFLLANWTKLYSRCSELDREKGNYRDTKFIKWLIKNVGVMVASGSALYTGTDKTIGENFIRICFAKKFETLEKAASLLLKQFG